MGRLFAYLVILAIIVAIPVGFYRQARYNSIRQVTLTVNTLPDRSVQYNANGDKNTYANLVYTDKGTFQNSDSWFPSKHNSSDLYGKLYEKGTFECEIVGWRWPVFNVYPDLIKCEAV